LKRQVTASDLEQALLARDLNVLLHRTAQNADLPAELMCYVENDL